MGILSKLFKDESPGLKPDDEFFVDQPATYNTAIDYITGLSLKDYNKLIKCADIARKAYADQCKVHGIPNEPTTFINPPEPELETIQVTNSSNFLDDDTELGNFLEDEPPKKVSISESSKPKGKK